MIMKLPPVLIESMDITDITNELKYLISSNLSPGQYMFSDHFNLEDTLPAIDIDNPKMDRGLLKIEGECLLDYVDTYFKRSDRPDLSVKQKQIDTSELLRNLFRLEMTWYSGKAFFSDTLLTCILMHREPSIILALTGNELAALAVEATMTAASLISYLIASSPVIREEDFHANLYGMNWWTCTYAGGNFPRPNLNTFITGEKHEFTFTSGELRLQVLLERLANVCRLSSGSYDRDRFYFARLYHWIKFLNEFIKTASIYSNSTSIPMLISELQSVLGEVEDDNILSSSDPVIFPELANIFGNGCVRPNRIILPLNSAIKYWNRSLNDDLSEFLGGSLLMGRPRFHDLVKLLSERSRDPLKLSMSPVSRALTYAALVQNRFRTIYQIEPRDQFVSTSIPGIISLSKLTDLPLMIQDLIQVYCCNPARQRRILPGLIEFWDNRVLKVVQDDKQLAGNRSICWLDHIRDLLALDLILLYGHLKLLTPPFEEFQAAHLIFLIFEKFRSDGQEIQLLPRNQDTIVNVPVVEDLIRWNHRWSIISNYLISNFNNSFCFPESFFIWFKSMIRSGLTSFSLPEPDWMNKNFCTPKSSVENVVDIGNSFTMFATELDLPNSSSSEF